VTNSAPDGIRLDAPGNIVTSNHANRNAEWGISAIEGTIDGGGNTAHHNGQPAQCSGVVCNRLAIAPTLRRRRGPLLIAFKPWWEIGLLEDPGEQTSTPAMRGA
jgi:hypothetical protein